MARRGVWALVFAAACAGSPEPADTDDTPSPDPRDTDVVDSDAPDTDAPDTDVVDSDAADTDVGDSDLVLDPGDTDTGLGDHPDTGSVDTDTVDTDPLDTDPLDTDPPLVDADQDGVPSTLDCDDADASVYPGATQRCDGVDRTCGQAPIDPDHTAWVWHADGSGADLTATFLAGTDGAPVVFATAAEDELRLCGGDWALSLSLSEGSMLQGVHQPRITHAASRSALLLGERTSSSGVDLDVSATDVAALEAAGAATFAGGDLRGAAWAVYVTGVGALTLDGVTVHDTTGPAITTWGGSGAAVTVLDSTIEHVGGAAVQTYGAASVTLTGVAITDASKGLSGSGATWSLTDVTMDAVHQPLEATGTTTATLDDVHVSGSSQVSTWYADALTVTGSSFSDGLGWVVSPLVTTTPITFDGCTFDTLDAGLGWGGALNVTGSAVTVTRSAFLHGHAGVGGAIYASTKIVVTDSTFTANTSQSGGALYLGESTVGPAEITDCTFTDNSSSWGGAVYTQAASTFLRDTFTRNRALAGGGAVFMASSGAAPTSLTDSLFEMNTAETGGGVCVTRLTTSGNTFRGNTALNGGAIYAYTPRDNLHLSGDAFYANAAAQLGGAVGWGPTMVGQGLIFGTGADANLPSEGGAGGTNVTLVDGDVTCIFATCVQ